MAEAQALTRVVLMLTEEEAGVLLDVLGSIGGLGKSREIANGIYGALVEVAPDEAWEMVEPGEVLRGTLFYDSSPLFDDDDE